MSTELLTRSNYELDDSEHIASSPDAVTAFALKRVVYIKELDSDPGINDEAWHHINQRLAIKNYLQNNGLNTPEENALASTITMKHGLTSENYKDYFCDAFDAGNLTSAYEIAHDLDKK